MSDSDELKALARRFALQNALNYDGKADPGAVIGKVMREMPELGQDAKTAVPLIREAGGQLTDWRGNAWDPRSDFVFASNGLIHEMLVSEIADLQPNEKLNCSQN